MTVEPRKAYTRVGEKERKKETIEERGRNVLEKRSCFQDDPYGSRRRHKNSEIFSFFIFPLTPQVLYHRECEKRHTCY